MSRSNISQTLGAIQFLHDMAPSTSSKSPTLRAFVILLNTTLCFAKATRRRTCI